MKRILLVRHAEAEPKQSGRADLQRRLTEAGRHEAVKVGHALSLLYGRFDCVVTSKAVRAIETAEAICRSLEIGQRLETVSLNPGCGADGWKETLAELPSDVKTAVLVGHEPDFSAMLGSAIGAPNARFRFKKLGCAEVGWDERDKAELVAFYPPDVLVRLGQDAK